MTTNRFDTAAATWDENPKRLKLIEKVYSKVIDHLEVGDQTTLLDFGTGTGLFGLKFIDRVKEVIFCDSSEGMLDQVKNKIEYFGIKNAQVINSDFSEEELPANKLNLITSFQVLHHVEKVQQLLGKFNKALLKDGQVCWIDLDKEDGTFHNDNTGVAHFGFSKDEVENYLSKSGFTVKYYNNEITIKKETAKGLQEFPIFICVANKV